VRVNKPPPPDHNPGAIIPPTSRLGTGLVRPRLTERQERELVIAAERGDADARHELVEAFLPAIVSVARSLSAKGRVISAASSCIDLRTQKAA
jgi:hypothetical protein